MILRYTQTSCTVQLAHKGLVYTQTSCTVQLAQKGLDGDTTVHTDIMHSSVSPEGAGR